MKTILPLAAIAISFLISNQTLAETTDVKCPVNTYVRKASGWALKVKQNFYANEVILKEVTFSCWDPVSNSYIENIEEKRLAFEDRLPQMMSVYKQARIAYAKECPVGEAIINDYTDYFDTPLFKCIPLNPLYPVQEIQLINKENDMAVVFEKGEKPLRDSPHFSFSGAINTLGVIPSTEGWAEAFRLQTQVSNPKIKSMLHLLRLMCNLNAGLHMGKVGASRNSQLQKTCWFTAEQYGPMTISGNVIENHLTRYIEAAVRALSADFYLPIIEDYVTPQVSNVLTESSIDEETGKSKLKHIESHTPLDLAGYEQNIAQEWHKIISYYQSPSIDETFELLKNSLAQVIGENKKAWANMVKQSEAIWAKLQPIGGIGQVPIDGRKLIGEIQKVLREEFQISLD